jgi:hypothetical protein
MPWPLTNSKGASVLRRLVPRGSQAIRNRNRPDRKAAFQPNVIDARVTAVVVFVPAVPFAGVRRVDGRGRVE